MNTIIGIDNSALDHKVSIIDQDGKVKNTFQISNDFNGFRLLESRMKQFNEPLIGMELSHGPLVDYLHGKGFHIYSLNPLKIKRYKEVLKVSGNKNDTIDSLAIAEYLKLNQKHAREMMFSSKNVEELKHLNIIRGRLVRDKATPLSVKL